MAFALAFGMAQEGAQTEPAQPETEQTQTDTQTQMGQAAGNGIMEYLQANENFTTLLQALETDAQIQQALTGQGIFTLFAPTNEAFGATEGQAAGAEGQTNLGMHLVHGALTMDVLEGMLQAAGGSISLPTVGGSQLTFSTNEQGQVVVGDTATLGESTVVGNGVIYTLDTAIGATGQAAVQQDAAQAEGEEAAGEQAEGEQAEGEQAEGEQAEGEQAEGEQAEGEADAAQAGQADPAQAGQAQAGQDITTALQDVQEFEQFRTAFEGNPQFQEQLTTAGAFTLFAPTNEAFTAGQDQAEAFTVGAAGLQHYVVQGPVSPEGLRQILEARGGQLNLLLQGGDLLPLTLDPENNVVVAGTAQLGEPVFTASGVIIPISTFIQEQAVIPAGEVQAGAADGEVAGGGEAQQQAQLQIQQGLEQIQQALQGEDAQGAQEQIAQVLQQLDQELQQAQGQQQQQLQQVQQALMQAQEALQNDDTQGAQQQIDQALQSLSQMQGDQ